jgi:bis(5'-nucleosidyl)-tetraphosphatase
MNPIREYSAGIIPFLLESESSRRFYLLIHSARVHNPRARWEFPKGGIEPGETPRQAAAREFIEETGLHAWRFRNGFARSITYTYVRNGLLRTKTVMYFIAEVLDPLSITRTREHVEDHVGRWYRWSRRGEVQQLLSHKTLRDLFQTADACLESSAHLGASSSDLLRA